MTYYNTNSLSGETLERKKRKLNRQESEIIELFKKHNRLSPGKIFGQGMMKGNPPITSIRRAISDLTKKDGMLRKLDVMVPGIYEEPEHVWEIVTTQGKLF